MRKVIAFTTATVTGAIATVVVPFSPFAGQVFAGQVFAG